VPAYDAFISYSHAKDKPIAAALQSVIQKLGKAWYERRAARVFRDDTSLSATPHLWPSIERALSESRHLILLASPEAAESPWIAKEVGYWLKHKSPDTLFIGLTGGELAWDNKKGDFKWTAKTPLPKVFKSRFSSEPKWVDLSAYRDGANPRNAKFIDLGADFAAAIRGVPKEDLMSEEVRQQRRLRRIAVGVAGIVLVLAALAVLQWRTAEFQKREAVAAKLQAETNERRANQERDKALTEQSRLLANTSERQFARGDYGTALLLALEALPDAETGFARPYVAEAEQWLDASYREIREKSVLGHAGAVTDIAFSTDGTRLATTASDEHVIHIWDTGIPGRETMRLTGHSEPVMALAFSPDGQSILTASEDDSARLWEVATGRPLATFTGHSDDVNWVAFSPETVGTKVLTASSDETVKIWELTTGKELLSLEVDSPVLFAAFSPDGSLVATGSKDGSAYIWNAVTGKRLHDLKYHSERILSLTFSPDGQRLITASADKTAIVWDVESGLVAILTDEKSTSLEGLHAPGARSAAYDRSGTKILTAIGQAAQIWDASTGRRLHTLAEHKDLVWFAAFSSDGQAVVTASADATVRIWDAESGEAKVTFVGHERGVRKALFSPDGRTIASASLDGTARIWTVDTAMTSLRLADGSEPMEHAAISPDGRWVAATTRDGVAHVWDAQHGAKAATFNYLPPDAEDGSLENVAFSPNGNFLLFGVRESPFSSYVWDWKGPKLIAEFEGYIDFQTPTVFTPDGSHLIGADEDTTKAKIMDLASGTTVMLEGHTADILSSRFSYDGKYAVTSSKDKSAILWDAMTGKKLAEFRDYPEDVFSLFDHATKRMITVSGNTMHLLDLATGAEIKAFEFPESRIKYGHVAINPGGRAILAAYIDGKVRLWDVASAQITATLDASQQPQFLSNDNRFLTGNLEIWDATARQKVASIAANSFVQAHDRLVTFVSPVEVSELFSSVRRLIRRAKLSVSRCLTPDQRQSLALLPEPPAWCITGSRQEAERNASAWRPLWPYQGDEWKNWLIRKNQGEVLPLPFSHAEKNGGG
jgi:WD40 repeat protein